MGKHQCFYVYRYMCKEFIFKSINRMLFVQGNHQFWYVPWNFLLKSKSKFHLQLYFSIQNLLNAGYCNSILYALHIKEKKHIHHINFQWKVSNKYNHKESYTINLSREGFPLPLTRAKNLHTFSKWSSLLTLNRWSNF